MKQTKLVAWWKSSRNGEAEMPSNSNIYQHQPGRINVELSFQNLKNPIMFKRLSLNHIKPHFALSMLFKFIKLLNKTFHFYLKWFQTSVKPVQLVLRYNHGQIILLPQLCSN